MIKQATNHICNKQEELEKQLYDLNLLLLQYKNKDHKLQLQLDKLTFPYEEQLLKLQKEKLILLKKIELAKSCLDQEQINSIIQSEQFTAKLEEQIKEKEFREKKRKTDAHIFFDQYLLDDHQPLQQEHLEVIAKIKLIRKKLLKYYHPDIILIRNPDLSEKQIEEIQKLMIDFISIRYDLLLIEEVLELKVSIEKVLGRSIDDVDETFNLREDQLKIYEDIIIKKTANLSIIQDQIESKRCLLNNTFNLVERYKFEIDMLNEEVVKLHEEYNSFWEVK